MRTQFFSSLDISSPEADKRFKIAVEKYKQFVTDLGDFRHNYMRLGKHLIEYEKERLYSVIKPINETYFSVVYKNIYEFAKNELNIKTSTCKNLIAVAKQFSDDQGNCKEEYKNYSYTQLVVLAACKDFSYAIKQRFTFDMKVEDMKLLYKAVKKGTYDWLLSIPQNLNKINEFLEAEKIEKENQILKNVKSLADKYKSQEQINSDGEILPENKIHSQLIGYENIKEYIEKNKIEVFKDGKKVNSEMVIKYLTDLIGENKGGAE